MICRYVHHDVEIEKKAQDFAHKLDSLEINIPKVIEDFKCRRAKLNIKELKVKL
jgi:hypothetical protein